MKTITWVKNNIILLGVILVLILFSLRQCRQTRIAEKKFQVAEQNISALNDTIRLVKTKDDKPEYNKLAFLVDKVSNLEKLSQDLAQEVKNTKGKVTTIIKGGVQIVHDTTEIWAYTTLDDDKIIANFDYDTTYSKGNSRAISGYTEYDTFTESTKGFITKDSMNVSFVTGIKNLDKGEPEIFLRSNYPGFSVTSLEGASLDPNLFTKKTKPRKIGIGIQAGYSPISYNFSTKKLGIQNQLTLGIGLNYKIF